MRLIPLASLSQGPSLPHPLSPSLCPGVGTEGQQVTWPRICSGCSQDANESPIWEAGTRSGVIAPLNLDGKSPQSWQKYPEPSWWQASQAGKWGGGSKNWGAAQRTEDEPRKGDRGECPHLSWGTPALGAHLSPWSHSLGRHNGGVGLDQRRTTPSS